MVNLSYESIYYSKYHQHLITIQLIDRDKEKVQDHRSKAQLFYGRNLLLLSKNGLH